jgi:hypothetical protein
MIRFHGQESVVGGAGAVRRREAATYALAVLVWAALGIWYKPILSMVLAPVWMVLFVSIIPARLGRRRERPR